MQVEIIDKIFSILYKHNTDPKTELVYNNDFTLLIAIILSARTRDVLVNKVTKKLFLVCSSPQEIISLGIHNLKKYIRKINFYNTKAKNIINLCNIIIRDHNSLIPDNFTQLISLPGIGRKTANLILNYIFKKITIAVDTHVFRVSRRVGLSNSKSKIDVEKQLLDIIPKHWVLQSHDLLVFHGKYVCKSRNPQCNTCLISKYCEYYKNL